MRTSTARPAAAPGTTAGGGSSRTPFAVGVKKRKHAVGVGALAFEAQDNFVSLAHGTELFKLVAAGFAEIFINRHINSSRLRIRALL